MAWSIYPKELKGHTYCSHHSLSSLTGVVGNVMTPILVFPRFSRHNSGF